MFIDNNKASVMGGLKLPKLKGHVKLTIRNVYTGKEEVVEGDNVITDAVADILRYNLLGSCDGNKILGDEGLWEKWFGGVICYNQDHEDMDPANYFMPNGSDNPVIAHAGQESIDSDHDDDPTRGNPASILYDRTDHSIKLVWSFRQDQGNGIIRALSLCHSDTGSYGNGVDSYDFKNLFNPWEEIQSSDLEAVSQMPRAAGNAFAQYDENHTLFFFIGEDEWYNYDSSVPYGEDMINEVTVYIRRLPYSKTGLFDLISGTDAASDTRKFTVETSIGFKYNPAWYFDAENKQLWLFNNFTYTVPNAYGADSPVPPHTAPREWSKNTVWYSVIDCETGTEIDSGTIVSDDDDLAFLECSADLSTGNRMKYNSRVIQQNILVADGYVYLPIGNSTNPVPPNASSTSQKFRGFKKINLSDQTEQEVIPFCDYESQTPTVMDKYYAAIKQGGLAAGFGWVMNNGMLYPCDKGVFSSTPAGWDVWDNIYMNEDNSPIVFATRRPANEQDNVNTRRSRYIFASKLLNTSKYEVNPPKQKTMSDTMQIEYTITEESES